LNLPHISDPVLPISQTLFGLAEEVKKLRAEQGWQEREGSGDLQVSRESWGSGTGANLSLSPSRAL